LNTKTHNNDAFKVIDIKTLFCSLLSVLDDIESILRTLWRQWYCLLKLFINFSSN